MRHLILGCLLLLTLPLNALLPQNTASANALAGITLLSQSVADRQHTPALPFTGLAISASVPFSDGPSTAVSLEAAQNFDFLNLGVGATHSGDYDYNSQDFRLGLALCFGDFVAGFSQHLFLERAGDISSHQSWNSDLGLAYRGAGYGYEARVLNLAKPEQELHLNVSTKILDGVKAGAGYVYSSNGDGGYRFATSIDLGENLLLQSSWQNNPSRFGAGLKFKLKDWDLMYSIRTHSALKLSHSLDLGYIW
ncbi:MAG: hypothetical protein GX135_07645 [Candidatus Cloacimonetes bacterium]|nr:hypothetical protein [Candidatus Cloacimonadota bacterium]